MSIAAQVDFTFRHNADAHAKPGTNIYLFVYAYQKSAVMHTTSRQRHGLNVGRSSVDNVRTSIFSHDVSGIYQIQFSCGLKPDVEQVDTKASIQRMIPHNG